MSNNTSAANSSKTIRILTECAILIAIGTILAQFKLFELPNGGSVTIVSMLPFMIISFRHGTKWGLMAGFANSLLQMAIGGIYTPPAGTFIATLGSVLLDYVIGFMVLGLAYAIAKPFGSNTFAGVAAGIIGSGLLRFVSSFLSGFLIWGSLVEDGFGAVTYSLTYNASYMVPEIVITAAAGLLLYKAKPDIFSKQK